MRFPQLQIIINKLLTTISGMIFKYLINNLINRINNYKNKKNNNNSNSSFGLLETAITVAIMGTIAGATLGAYNATNPQVRNDLKKMEKIEEALQRFFTVNGRLPFPANPTFSLGNNLYLKESRNNAYNNSHERCICNSDSETIRECGSRAYSNGGESKFNHDNNTATDANSTSIGCTHDFVLWGVVPTRSLGLSDDYAYDSQGHNFEYITHATLAYPFNTSFTYSSQRAVYYKTAYVLDGNGKYNTKHETSNGSYSAKNIPMERLLIHDAINNKDLMHTKNNTAYVIISKGKTGKCFFDTKSNVIETTLPDNETINNCVQSRSNPDYRVNTSVDRKIYQGYSKSAFDNLVRYKTVSDLMQLNSNIKDKIRGSTIGNYGQYVEKNTNLLQTNSKNIVEAINELKNDLDAIQFGTLAPTTSTSAGLTNVDNTVVKNIALWKPGKYKFDNNSAITNYYSSQLPRAPDGNYYAGELNIYDIYKESVNPLDTTITYRYRLYEYTTYNGYKWIAKIRGGDDVWSNSTTIQWINATCEINWPIGSIYISTSLSNATDVATKLGCGEWMAIGKNKVLWSTTSGAGTTLSSCAPNVSGWFHANKELNFSITEGTLFSLGQSGGDFALGSNGIASTYCKIMADFGSYNNIWGRSDCATINMIRPASVSVYMWKRCDGSCTTDSDGGASY